MPVSQPFHDGEVTVQQAFDVVEEGENIFSFLCFILTLSFLSFISATMLGKRMVQPLVPQGVRPYLSSLTYILVASVEIVNNLIHPWSSIIFGEEGFVSTSADGQTIKVTNARISMEGSEPLLKNLQNTKNGPISFLAIDFEHRNRYRINGRVSTVTYMAGLLSFTMKTEECFGNCPKVRK